MMQLHIVASAAAAPSSAQLWRPSAWGLRSQQPRLSAAADAEAERKERMQQLFGGDYKDETAKELARVAKVEQPAKPEPVPEWTLGPSDGESTAERDWATRRLTLWLEERGQVDLDKVLIVQTESNRLALATAKDVSAGDVLFDIPDSLLLNADVAFEDVDVGRALRDMAPRAASRGKEAGFDTFAIAAVLAAERVRRGAVRGKLRRQDGGVLQGGSVLPQWQVNAEATLQSNAPFSPFINSLDWPDDDECIIEADRAEAVTSGAKLLAKMIEPTARNAWMQNTQGRGLAQATSDEDVECTAMQALLLAISLQLDPPPPIGIPRGTARWGGVARAGPALCPLVNLVVASPDDMADRDPALFNAQVGRPTSGRTDSAVRCVATTDMPMGTIVISDVPGGAAAPGAAPMPPAGARVRVVEGIHGGSTGKVITLRGQQLVVRLDEGERPLVVLSASILELVGDPKSGRRTREM